MGASYARAVFGVDAPRVGILSNGAEESKGNNAVHSAAAMLGRSEVNFVGSIEGSDVFAGACEVAVVDGFAGNLLLKGTEGCAELLFGLVSDVLAHKNPDAVLSVARRMDYAELGGAPLLGIDGVVIVCHGRSTARAIANAVREACRAVARNVNAEIVRGLAPERPERPASREGSA
jgi:glycerol-3-phosphate acyltransferase PlsX